MGTEDTLNFRTACVYALCVRWQPWVLSTGHLWGGFFPSPDPHVPAHPTQPDREDSQEKPNGDLQREGGIGGNQHNPYIWVQALLPPKKQWCQPGRLFHTLHTVNPYLPVCTFNTELSEPIPGSQRKSLYLLHVASSRSLKKQLIWISHINK